MPQSKDEGLNHPLVMFLPLVGFLFPRKSSMNVSEENPMKFHLDMINKIDKLLAEHHLEPPSSETLPTPSFTPTSRQSVPIEPRPLLTKPLTHEEFTWEPTVVSSDIAAQNIPEEFKTELNINPGFRFITSQEFKSTILPFRRSPEERVEIIDLNTLIQGKTTRREKNNLNKEIIIDGEEEFTIEDIHRKKTEVIDVQTLKHRIHEDFYITPLDKNEKTEKPRIYYFKLVTKKDELHKKVEREQTSSSLDVDERFKKLKEEQMRAEEQRKQQGQEMYQQLERERENLETRFKKFKEEQMRAEERRKQQEKIMYDQLEREREKFRAQQIKEEQRRLQEAERQKQLAQIHEKIREQQIDEELLKKEQEQEIYGQFKREHENLEELEGEKPLTNQRKQELKQTEQKSIKQIPLSSMSPRDVKKQAKEQKRLQRLEIRKARIEKRRQAKEEKQAQKIKQKNIQQKTTTTESPELDDDLKKILLMTDSLLGELPEDVINQFMQTEEFELYQKVLNKYRIKE